jgi:peptidoglycan/xylan/chitin deacetylase (PgdA/CDA1 family)
VVLTDALLARAAALSAPITVFAVGTWLRDNPGVAAKILAGGHELANHTWSHGDIIHMPQSGVRSEITECRDVIASQTGVHADYFRPSQTDVPNDLILTEAGLAGYGTVVGYDIDPLDYNDPGASLVLSRVRGGLHGGAIVSLHLGHPGTVTAFDGIVRSIRARGLRPVVVRDLLSQG